MTEDNKYLTNNSETLIFKIGDSYFGVPVLSVIEIKEENIITKLPNYPKEILGVANIRGETITIVSSDLFLNTNKNLNKNIKNIDIILSNTPYANIGFRVDEVIGIEYIEKSNIKPVSELNLDLKFVDCVAHVKDKIALLLNPQKMLSSLKVSQ